MQIGNAITEKKVLDVLLQARDRGLYHAITDCGAGGFSSAVGEMGEKLGADVAPRPGAAQVRGPVVHRNLDLRSRRSAWSWPCRRRTGTSCRALCASEDVEATVIGTFEATGRLRLFYQGEQVGRPRRCTSCTTAGRRWCGRRRGEPRSPAESAAPAVAEPAARGIAPTTLLQDPRLAQRLQQGMDHPPVRSRSAGRQRHQAAGRRARTTAPATPR